MKKYLLSFFIVLFSLASFSLKCVSADDGDNPYYHVETIDAGNGKFLEKATINGPSTPPPGFESQRISVDLPESNSIQGSNSLAVPAFDWYFGCSATSGAMIAAYYDRNGYPNMYTGPTNGGVMPLDSSPWDHWADGYGGYYEQCPLTASHSGLDGRTTRGSIDNYWVKYGSSTQDPYLTNGWTQHTWGDAIGDYMKTSQSAFYNTDGSTTFYTWISSPSRLTCNDMVEEGIHIYDGTYGRKLFYEARGYTVTDCYNQKTDNIVSGGFSYAQYKAEIDAGRPVMLNLEGHTVVGVGYSDPDTVYIHDTWDYGTYPFTWGGSYSDMELLSVSIVNLEAPQTGTVSGTILDKDSGDPIVGVTVSALGASQTTSSTDGAYSLDLLIGVYTITASATGYLTDTITSVSVAEDSITTLNIDLTPQTSLADGYLTGSVSDIDSGNPLPGATVSAPGVGQTISGETGVYSLTLPTGVYTITASAPGYTPTTVVDVPISGGLTTTQNFNLHPLDSLWYAPATLETTILSGTNNTVALTLTNNSTAPISYTLMEAVGGGDDGFLGKGDDEVRVAQEDIKITLETDVPWLSQNPITGTIAAGDSQVIDVTFDASAVTQIGQHNGTLNIISDDAVNPDMSVPVAMNVYDEFTISGNAGVAGAILSYTDDVLKTVTAESNGNYAFIVTQGWSGAVTPSKAGYIFSPVSRTYTNVQADQSGQNYTARFTVYLPTIIR